MKILGKQEQNEDLVVGVAVYPDGTIVGLQKNDLFFGDDEAIGHWIHPDFATKKSYIFYCSVCKQSAYYVQGKQEGCGYRYCPNCGCRMDVKGDFYE